MIAELYNETNRVAETEPLYVRSLQLAEAQHGPQSPQLIQTLIWIPTVMR